MRDVPFNGVEEAAAGDGTEVYGACHRLFVHRVAHFHDLRRGAQKGAGGAERDGGRSRGRGRGTWAGDVGGGRGRGREEETRKTTLE